MAFAPGEIEDGTGLDDAIVYEDVPDVESWLTRRGKTSFSGKTDPEKEAILITSTEAIESEFALYFRGVRRRASQGLLWPAAGARAINGRLFRDFEIPSDYLVSIRLVCELQAGDAFLTSAAMGHVKRFKGGPAEVEFRDSARLDLISVAHPQAWHFARRALPGDP